MMSDEAHSCRHGRGGAEPQRSRPVQIRETPGLSLVAVADIEVSKAEAAATLYREKPFARNVQEGWCPSGPTVLKDIIPFLELSSDKIDVLVEATNTVSYASRASIKALEKKINVVLMNAEVDALLGPLLHKVASENGAMITSDAGDQHGVLMRMVEEISMWGFRPVMAGNIKGFLNRYATASSLIEEARVRNLNPVQCAAYTDGTKLNIEMALVSSATGMEPFCRGMEGPRADDVNQVFEKFDFNRYQEKGVVDYILGATPGGGVYVVGYCSDPVQMSYLSYYKMGGGPFYLFYRPYHLCHLETPRAIAKLCLQKRAILEPVYGQPSVVIAFAKRDLKKDDEIKGGIGGDYFYGLIEHRETAETINSIPIALIEPEDGKPYRMKRDVPKDGAVTFDDLEIPDSELLNLHHKQQQLLTNSDPSSNDLSVYPD